MNDTSFFSDNTSFRRAKLINFLYQTADYGTNKFQSMEVLFAMSKDTIGKESEKFWKKQTVAEKWSNLYFAYSIDYKVRSFRVLNETGIEKEEALKVMSVVEHNRWNVEKLLMGYRKPKVSEDMYNKSDEIAKKLKNNKNLFIHPQIRPFVELTEDMKQLDKEFNKYIPWIVSIAP